MNFGPESCRRILLLTSGGIRRFFILSGGLKLNHAKIATGLIFATAPARRLLIIPSSNWVCRIPVAWPTVSQ
jgi:hypothetical protein